MKVAMTGSRRSAWSPSCKGYTALFRASEVETWNRRYESWRLHQALDYLTPDPKGRPRSRRGLPGDDALVLNHRAESIWRCRCRPLEPRERRHGTRTSRDPSSIPGTTLWKEAKRVVKAAQEPVVKEVADLRQRVQTLADQTKELVRTKDEQMNRALRAVTEVPSFESVTEALAIAQGLGALAAGIATVQGGTDPIGWKDADDGPKKARRSERCRSNLPLARPTVGFIPPCSHPDS
ncbi:MAG TPA: hypothetical protein VIP09_06330 [Dehalococcoidia bacterium]